MQGMSQEKLAEKAKISRSHLSSIEAPNIVRPFSLEVQKRKGRIVMIYTEEVRKELDAILKAFEDYIDGQDYFDIVYSKKIGYVWIVADEPGAAGAEQLDTPEAMLDNLFNTGTV